MRRPPVDSGSRRNLIVILLLGGAILGLFTWRHFQTPPVVVAPAPSSSATAAAHPSYSDPVDIPPPPDLPDASPDTGGPKPATTAWSGEGCSRPTCSGRISPELTAAMAFRAKTAHKCYDEALGLDSTLKGQVVIGVRVSYDGTVCSASVESNDLANGSVAACIANKFRQGARLPSPLGGCVDVNVPMKLLPPH
jgi:hypothetical protein